MKLQEKTFEKIEDILLHPNNFLKFVLEKEPSLTKKVKDFSAYVQDTTIPNEELPKACRTCKSCYLPKQQEGFDYILEYKKLKTGFFLEANLDFELVLDALNREILEWAKRVSGDGEK